MTIRDCYFLILLFHSLISINKLLFLDQHTNIEVGIIPRKIDVNFKHNTAGFISKIKSKICPGDFVFVTYDETPIIKDMQCSENFEEAFEDHEIGGHNDWYIETFTKYKDGGWMVKAQRNLKTRDKFDDQLMKEPDRILFALHEESYEFQKPSKSGVRSLSKFEKMMNNQIIIY